MKTITYNPETHKLVPLEPTQEMTEIGAGVIDDNGGNARWSDVREAYAAMLNAAPAAEEAPQQEPTIRFDDLRDRLVAVSQSIADQDDRAAQAILRETLSLLSSEQQPATHGEPVAYLVYAGVCDMRPVYPAHSTRASAEAMAREIKSVTEVRPLFLSPTPMELRSGELVQAARQALEAGCNCTPQGYEAITTLQNALKGST